MQNADIFIYPGHAALSFLLSLVGLTQDVIDPYFQSIFSFILALIIWISIIKLLMRLASKALGLDQQGGKRQ